MLQLNINTMTPARRIRALRYEWVRVNVWLCICLFSCSTVEVGFNMFRISISYDYRYGTTMEHDHWLWFASDNTYLPLFKSNNSLQSPGPPGTRISRTWLPCLSERRRTTSLRSVRLSTEIRNRLPAAINSAGEKPFALSVNDNSSVVSRQGACGPRDR